MSASRSILRAAALLRSMPLPTPTAIYDLEAQIDAYTVLDPDDIEKANVRYPAEELPASQLLSGFVEESGFGNFDSISLRKATAGKVASASLSVGAYSESVNASCSPQDMWN